MKKFKHIETGAVISEETYHSLMSFERAEYGEVSNSGDFLLSAVIGAATDSALLGGLLGGSFLGGMAGDLFDGDLFD